MIQPLPIIGNPTYLSENPELLLVINIQGVYAYPCAL